MSALGTAKTVEFPHPRWLIALLSLIIPGLGQAWFGDRRRGFGVFLMVATSLVTTIWYGVPGWYLLPAALWIWNIWDAFRLPRGASIGIAALLWLVMAYGIGWQVTQINLASLFKNQERAASILKPMLQPDFLARREIRNDYSVGIQVPCTANPPRAEKTTGGVHITASPDCATINDGIVVIAEGLRPNYPTEITWVAPTGGVIMLKENNTKMLILNTDEKGGLTFMITVPRQSEVNATSPLPYHIRLTQREILSGFAISKNGRYILQGIYETLALALLATALGAILALPLSFLAARNLMSGNLVTMTIYTITRTLLNIFRSIEALIMAIIFVVIVGLGPFPGMLALTVHTTAALGKLYSEVIEGIDPGPIEAIRATGATWLQVARYAVIPQIVPPFTALTIYRWDINVRSSTIIGFVGGGGIGFFLWQWIILGDYRAVSASFITIAIVVIIMDFFSARLRERIG
jgi:phosphonate transport system permease protein